MAKPVPENPSPFRRWLKTNQGVGAFLSLLLIAFLIKLQFTEWVHLELRDGFTLGFFPRMGVGLMLLFTAVMIIDRYKEKEVKELDIINRNSIFVGAIVLLGSYVYFAFMVRIGYILVTPFFMWAFIYLMGVPSLKYSVVSSLAVTVFVYALFTGLGINLPLGVLESYLY